jgi:hypothetical protein
MHARDESPIPDKAPATEARPQRFFELYTAAAFPPASFCDRSNRLLTASALPWERDRCLDRWRPFGGDSHDTRGFDRARRTL